MVSPDGYDHVAIWDCFGKRFAQLLDDPLRRRVPSHVAVQDLPASMFDDEEAVEQLEGQRRYREEVESDDHLAVILEEGQPPFAWVATTLDTSKIAGDGPFRDDEAEFQKLSVDLGCAPACNMLNST